METVKLIRNEKQTHPDVQTLGSLWHNNEMLCVTLELPWKDNKRKVSCIPTGTYKVVRRISKKYGQHFHITNVPGRTLILIHAANYVTDLLGCIGVGSKYAFINKDAILDIANSKKTMALLLKELPIEFDLIIT
jgi:hypothetical protein